MFNIYYIIWCVRVIWWIDSSPRANLNYGAYGARSFDVIRSVNQKIHVPVQSLRLPIVDCQQCRPPVTGQYSCLVESRLSTGTVGADNVYFHGRLRPESLISPVRRLCTSFTLRFVPCRNLFLSFRLSGNLSLMYICKQTIFAVASRGLEKYVCQPAH